MSGEKGKEAPGRTCAGCLRSLRVEAGYRALQVDREGIPREVLVCFSCRHRISVEGHWRRGEGPDSYVLTTYGCGACG
jgi:hypothetical protein